MTDGDACLASLRVLDLSDGDAAAVTRLLADLGADVLKIEPPGGAQARRQAPTLDATSIGFALDNANKRAATLDPGAAADRRRFFELVSGCDIVVDSGRPGRAAAFGTSCAQLARRHGHVVAMSVTDFGTSGPRARWSATDAELYALSTALSRSGPPTGTPVLPPDGLASHTAAVQAAWAVLVAYFHRLRSGRGEYVDFSRFEGVVQALDPPFGSAGQAVSGVKDTGELWRGRPRNQQIYPIFACRDGHVRICVLSARQWRALHTWLGAPRAFADPSFDTIAARYAASRELNATVAEFFAAQPVDRLVSEGQARGIPIAAVHRPADALMSAHFRAVGAVTKTELAPGRTVSVPVGPVVIDGRRAGYARRVRAAGTDSAAWAAPAGVPGRTRDPIGLSGRPFDGMRIVDLGVIVAGGELGRLFADMGAEVVKVESASYPDGLRQAPPGRVMSRSWALTHRNEYSVGVDLRRPAGADVFARLISRADALFANFKPGTLAALGFPPERLRALNPALVLAESSAYGATGPWSDRMGYGPLVRAATGVTRLWAGAGTDAFFDATTVFPDHVVARVTAIATLAAFIRRRRTGTGAHVHVAQAEVAVAQLGATYVAEEARSAGHPVTDDPVVHAVCPCDGEDEWCVVSVRSAADRDALAAVVGELPDDGRDLEAVVSAWTAHRDPAAAAAALQRGGVPAAPMNRAADVLSDPQLTHRRVFSALHHPLFDGPIPSETGPAPYTHIPRADLRPAPLPGEHTRDICQKVLGMDSAEIAALFCDGVLFSAKGS